MQFKSSDPDIETLVRRVERGLIDLQPDFQRGEVWSTAKKQRLIDSIIRGWHVPPIHLVKRDQQGWDVLDGQQRLTAIRDFVRGEFAIDGRIEPVLPDIQRLHGLKWGRLEVLEQEAVNTFTIRVFELTDYSPAEPYELFFRLNQPTNLTEAEKRNAFIGGPRNQVKELSRWAEELGMTSAVVGFSNARMAYDDVISRFMLTLAENSLLTKATSARITEIYRSGQEFGAPMMSLAKEAIAFTLLCIRSGKEDMQVKPNRATIHTWFCLSAAVLSYQGSDAVEVRDAARRVIQEIEHSRSNLKARADLSSGLRGLISVFDDRSTSRVMDVSSVVLRDFISWSVLWNLVEPQNLPGTNAAACRMALALANEDPVDLDSQLLTTATECAWGGRWI